MLKVAENHLLLQALNVGLVATGLKERTLVILKFALEIALFDAATSATDVA